MYDPNEARKSYSTLFSERIVSSGITSMILVAIWYFINKYILQQELPLHTLFGGFVFFSVYFTWKPKLIRFLRGRLRGEEYRDKGD